MSRPSSASNVFQAIADPTRRAILDRLREGERPVAQIGKPLRISQSALSQHLAVLRKAHLVGQRRVGRTRFYKLRPKRLQEVSRWINHFDRFWNEKLKNLGKYLEKNR